MSYLHTSKPRLMLVRFEQGRGRTGIPRTWVWVGQDIARNAPGLESVVETTVWAFRAMCKDPGYHGKDLMPGDGAENYYLHGIDQGRYEKVEDIVWETRWDGIPVAEAVLVYDTPSEILARDLKRRDSEAVNS